MVVGYANEATSRKDKLLSWKHPNTQKKKQQKNFVLVLIPRVARKGTAGGWRSLFYQQLLHFTPRPGCLANFYQSPEAQDIKFPAFCLARIET